MKAISKLILCLIMLVTLGCGDDGGGDGSADYKNSLTLGMGVSNNYKLLGVTDTFSGGLLDIYWRLESEMDISQFNIQLEIQQITQTGFITEEYRVYRNVNHKSHVLINKFNHQHGRGHFKVIATIESSGYEIAETTYYIP